MVEQNRHNRDRMKNYLAGIFDLRDENKKGDNSIGSFQIYKKIGKDEVAYLS